MEMQKRMLTSTHVDRHGDCMSRDALLKMAADINRSYVPVGVEHDPRHPPIGRIVAAEILALPDGHWGLEGTLEFWTNDEVVKAGDANREIPMKKYALGQFDIGCDRHFWSELYAEELSDLEVLLGAKRSLNVKKALDPIAVLQIGVGVALGHIATGFLQQVGVSAFEKVKQLLASVLKRDGADEKILQFQLSVYDNTRAICAEVIITNPSQQDIDLFLGRGLQQLDQLLLKVSGEQPELAKIVLKFADGKFKIEFGVRKDAVPMFPDMSH